MLRDLTETFLASIGSMGLRPRPAVKQKAYDVRESGCERLVTYGKLGSSEFIRINYRPPSVTVTSPDKSPIM